MTGPFDPRTVHRRIAAALGANLAGRVIAILVQLAVPPLFLWCWHVELYGEWLLLTALPASLAASDLGFCAAAANDMTMHASRGDAAGARSVFQCALGLVLTVGVVVTAAIVLLLSVMNPAALLGLTLIDGDTARLVLALLTLRVALGLPGELLLGGFRSAGCYAEGLMVGNLLALADFAVIVAALAGLGTPTALALAVVLAQLLRLVVTAGLMCRRLGWSHLPFPRLSLAEYRRLLKPALGFAVIPLTRAVVNQGLVILIGVLGDPRQVVAFTTTRTAARLVSTVADLVANAIAPELSVAWAAGNRPLLQSLLFAAGRAALWSGVAVALLLLVGHDLLARLWLHGAIRLEPVLLLPLMAAELLSGLGRVAFALVAAANRHAGIAFANCLLSLMALALAVPAILAAGLPGAAVAVALGEAIMLAITLRRATAEARTSITTFLGCCLIPPRSARGWLTGEGRHNNL